MVAADDVRVVLDAGPEQPGHQDRRPLDLGRDGKGALARPQRRGRQVALDDRVDGPEPVEDRLEHLLRDRHLLAIAIEGRLVERERRDNASAAPLGLDQRVRDVRRPAPTGALRAPRCGNLDHAFVDGHGGDATPARGPASMIRRIDIGHGARSLRPSWSDDDGAHRPRGDRRRRARRDPNHRPLAQGAWTLYDFANTMFSFAVVSGAIGLYLVNDRQFGERDGNVVLSLAIIVSVALNAARVADPRRVLRLGRPAHALPARASRPCASGPRSSSRTSRRSWAWPCSSSPTSRYQAALIYYDATLKTVSTPQNRGKLSGIGTGIGYCGTIFIGLLIFLLDIPVAGPLPARRRPCSSCSRSRSSCSSASGAARTSAW